MGWRKIVKEDIQRGTIIRLGNLMRDGSYCMATIIGINKINDEKYPCVMIARPYAYAHKDFDCKHPMLSAEVFEISIESLLSPSSDVEVFEGRDSVRSLAT